MHHVSRINDDPLWNVPQGFPFSCKRREEKRREHEMGSRMSIRQRTLFGALPINSCEPPVRVQFTAATFLPFLRMHVTSRHVASQCGSAPSRQQ